MLQPGRAVSLDAAILIASGKAGARAEYSFGRLRFRGRPAGADDPGEQSPPLVRLQLWQIDQLEPVQIGQPGAARHQHPAPRRPGQQRPDLSGALGVVENHEHPAAGQQAAISARPLVGGARDVLGRNVEVAQQPRQHVGRDRRIGRGARELHVQLPVGKAVGAEVRGVHRQRGLPDAAWSRDRRDRRRPRTADSSVGERLAQPADLRRPSGEVVQVGRKLPRDRPRRRLAVRRLEGGIGREDLLVQPLQLRIGVDAELGAERAAGVGVGRQRLALPLAAIQREHEPFPQPLTERILPDQAAQFHDDRVVAARPQVDVESCLQCLKARLGQQLHLGPPQVGGGHVGQRLALPQRQRVAQESARALPRGPDGGVRSRAELGEPAQVELVRTDLNEVAGGDGDDPRRFRFKQAAQPFYVTLNGVAGAGGRRGVPQGLRQRLPRHDLPGPEQQGREHDPFLGRQPDELIPDFRADRPEKREPRHTSIASPSSAVQLTHSCRARRGLVDERIHAIGAIVTGEWQDTLLTEMSANRPRPQAGAEGASRDAGLTGGRDGWRRQTTRP